MKQYQDLLKNILDNGTRRMDRTGTGTISIFGTQMRFDLKQGFPLDTSRKLYMKGLVHELLWMITGSTTNRTLIDQDVHFWDEWGVKRQDITKSVAFREALRSANPHTGKKDTRYEYSSAATCGDLGLVYGGLWRRWPTFNDRWIDIETRMGPVPGPVEIPSYAKDGSSLPELTASHYPEHWENEPYSFRVLGEYEENKQKMVAIRFDGTSSIKRVNSRELLSGKITDPYATTIYGVGCIGIVPNALSTPLYTLWSRMMSRCYDSNNPTYRREGKNGNYVCPRWLCFENFFRDVKQLPHYETWVKNPDQYDISPIYYGSNCYSLKTAVFLSNNDIVRYGATKQYIVTNPNGIVSEYFGLTDLARGLQTKTSLMVKHLDGSDKLNKLKHYIIGQVAVEKNGTVRRQRIFVDQLGDLISALKKDPFSRRHVITAWMPSETPLSGFSPNANAAMGNQALTACHCMFQFFCRELAVGERIALLNERHEIGFTQDADDDYIYRTCDENSIPKFALSCQLYQRSVDSVIGLPYNIASYALLTHLVAQSCNMVADEFVWTGGDTHIYLNHLEGVQELLKREPLQLPTLWINPAVRNIEDFTFDDIKIKGYKPHPKLDFEISV